mgnify:CR=1 FL=1
MKFSEYPYHTIDVKQAKDTLVKIEKRLMSAEDYPSFKQAFKDLDVYKKELYTQFSLCEVRHTIDTRNEYYKKEQGILMKLHQSYRKIWFVFLM